MGTPPGAATPVKDRDRPHLYVPIDRRIALAAGRDLPTDVWGTALEADLSGFTALTESLAQELGEQRGAEELTRRLNAMYDGLLQRVHFYGGTVLGFSGDAFTCWLDGDDGLRAVTCARSLQAWMADYASEVSTANGSPPKLKVALATGATRRFLVGDASVQLLEGLAGALVDELAAVEHEAEPGDVVLAESTRASLGPRVATGAHGTLLGWTVEGEIAPWTLPDEAPSTFETVRPWLLSAVFDRLVAGEGEFVADLRPATALFLRFSGIRFEADPDALERLDAFIRRVQGVLSRYEGTLIQLTIGDKGSYLYAAFGAPVAHEDDPTRALLAASDLRRLGGRSGLVDPVSIGVASGRLRAGAYGGSERRTYGVLGDAVNLSARLMQAARPGEIIATREVTAATAGRFAWTAIPDLTVKGKTEPVAAAILRAVRGRTTSRRRAELGDMLGRAAELNALSAALDGAAVGRGEVVAVTAEAGMGKTRLVKEMLREADRRRIAVLQGECPSFGINDSYVVWRPIFQQLLRAGDAKGRVDAARAQLARANPALVPRLPLLSPLVGARIPDTDLTRSFDAKVRKTSLEATVAEWLRATTASPTVMLLEDVHWIDPLSEDLLEVVARTARELPLLVVATHRPRGEPEGGEFAISRQPHYREIPLGRLGDEDVDVLIRARLARTTLPKSAAEEVSRLAQRAEGNPFYVGELVDYIVELGPDALDPARLAELPTSLQSLILSRIDRLDERPRSALKVASAIGRVFEGGLLTSVHRELAAEDLGVLHAADFVLPEAEDRYAFKHAITQEVAYSTIVGDTRSELHARIGRELEDRAGSDIDRHLDVLAHHFGRSDDTDRRRTYVLRAADAAQARYANRAAIDYFRNVLPLLDGAEQGDVLVKLGRALGLTGSWDEAAVAFTTARDHAVGRGDVSAQAAAETELAELLRKQGRYGEALDAFEAAKHRLDAAGDATGVAEILHLEGTLAAQQGDTAVARGRYEQSLDARRALDDRRGMARSLNGLGIVAEYEGDLATAAALYEESLVILTELGDIWGVAAVTNNAGMALLLQGRPATALPLFERAVALQREIGDPQMLANFLSNLGDAARELGDPDTAMRCYEESLVMSRELGERWLITYLLEDVAVLAAQEGRAEAAVRLASAGARLRDEIGAPLPPDSQRKLDERLEGSRSRLGADRSARAWSAGAGLTLENAIEEALFVRNAEKAGLAIRTGHL